MLIRTKKNSNFNFLPPISNAPAPTAIPIPTSTKIDINHILFSENRIYIHPSRVIRRVISSLRFFA